MNPKKQHTVTSGNWSVGSCTEHYGKRITTLQPFKVYQNIRGKCIYKHGDMYGLEVESSDVAHKLMHQHGYSEFYGRNTGSKQFVMSRAARKRGYVTDNPMYRSSYNRFHADKLPVDWSKLDGHNTYKVR